MIETICTPCGEAAFPVVVKCDACGAVITDSGTMASEAEHFCEDCSTPANQEFRICVHCGLPMIAGMTNEGNGLGADFHCHEGCFEDAMDARYPNGWRESPTSAEGEGEYGGYYEELLDDGTWEDTGIFYTEWY